MVTLVFHCSSSPSPHQVSVPLSKTKSLCHVLLAKTYKVQLSTSSINVTSPDIIGSYRYGALKIQLLLNIFLCLG